MIQSLTKVKDKRKETGKGKENRTLKGIKKDKSKQVPKATKKRKDASSSSSEGEEDHGEIWIQCNLWAHNECSGADKEHVCDFGK